MFNTLFLMNKVIEGRNCKEIKSLEESDYHNTSQCDVLIYSLVITMLGCCFFRRRVLFPSLTACLLMRDS